MVFYIYDPKGFRYPYHPDWREIRRVDETLPYTEKHSERNQRITDALANMKKAPYWKITKNSQQSLLASHLMKSPVLTLPPETPLFDAWKFFCEHRFRHIPITNSEGKLIGILSDRKLLQELAQISPTPMQHFPSIIEEIMVTNVLTAHPHTEISMIAKILINEHIGCIPIVNDEGSLVGIITRTDIVRSIIKIENFGTKV